MLHDYANALLLYVLFITMALGLFNAIPVLSQELNPQYAISQLALNQKPKPPKAYNIAVDFLMERFYFMSAKQFLNSHFQNSEYQVLQWITANIDQDDAYEIIAHTTSEKQKKHASTLHFFKKINNEYIPVLQINNALSHNNAPREIQLSSIQNTIKNHNNTLELCEHYGSTWNIEECSRIILSPDYKPFITEYTTQTRWNDAPSKTHDNYNFQTNIAQRSYLHYPQSGTNPIKYDEVNYQMVFASYENKPLNPLNNKKITRQSPAFELYPNQKPLTKTHLHFYFYTTWNESSLNIYINIPNHKLQPQPLYNTSNINHHNHIQCILDLSPELGIPIETSEDWILKYRRDYYDNPYRHELDPNIFIFAVNIDDLKQEMIPIHPSTTPTPIPKIHKTINNNEMQIHIEFPALFFNTKNLLEYDARINGLGFTLLMHKINNPDDITDFSQYATSQWKWADPYTLGQLWMKNPLSTTYPIYPLNWDKWINP